MRFATLPDGSPDGRLHLISRDNAFAVAAEACTTLQSLLENWDALIPHLEAQSSALNSGQAKTAFSFEPTSALAPLPRAWQWLDGSAFDSHGDLLASVFGFDAKQGKTPFSCIRGFPTAFWLPPKQQSSRERTTKSTSKVNSA